MSEDGEHGGRQPATSAKDVSRLALVALGVVYGDIGTSPLYTIKECFNPSHGLDARDPENVLGILSLVFWSLTLIVAVKYLTFVMRADNKGDGGIMALLALVKPTAAEHASRGSHAKTWSAIVLLGLFATALLFGEGIITPAISVCSAVEGLEVATPVFKPFVVPIVVVILAALFAVQRRGTGGIGAVFGPAMLVWFVTIAALGLPWIVREPSVLLAVDPRHAAYFFSQHGLAGFLLLGSVILCITGAEALYADMGHFGRGPIRWAWFVVAFPALLINYFGQGAILLETSDPDTLANPFYALAPRWFLYPLVIIATAAACIASQALISGSFSIAQQAVSLGYLPRLTILHTSSQAKGQVYLPFINWLLMLGCLALVLIFRSANGLSAAYGLAVIGTMTTTSILLYIVARHRWNWSRPKAALMSGLFLCIDLPYLFANGAKIPSGAWVPLAIGAVLFTVMSTWKRGRERLEQSGTTLPMADFLRDLERQNIPRVDGNAVFMAGRRDGVPLVLLHHFKHNKVLHKQVILLHVSFANVPRVDNEERLVVENLGQGFFRVVAEFGFMESPTVTRVLRLCRLRGLVVEPTTASYYLGRETILASARPGMAVWRKHLYALLSQNSRPATSYFGLPPNRVVELGSQIEI